MFSKNRKSAATPRQSAALPRSVPPSLISEDLTIAGDFKGEGDIQIDGTVNGDIRCNTLLVGESAKIKGEIIAESARVHGTVNGQIQAHTVSLAHTARVVANILHENLSIEQGAFLEGHCKRIDTKKERADTPVSLMVKGAGGADTPAKPAASGAGPAPDTGKNGADPKKVAAS